MPEQDIELQPQMSESAAPQEQPVQQGLLPGQAMMHVDETGIVAMSVAIVKAPPETMNQMCKDWLLNHNPGLIGEIVQEHVERLQKQKAHLQIVRDPATVKKISKSKNRLQA